MPPPPCAPTAAGSRHSRHQERHELERLRHHLPQRQRACSRAREASSPPVAQAFGARCAPQLRARRRRRAQSAQPSFSVVGAMDRCLAQRPPPFCRRTGASAPGPRVVVAARRSGARQASCSTVTTARRSRRGRPRQSAPAFVGVTSRHHVREQPPSCRGSGAAAPRSSARCRRRRHASACPAVTAVTVVSSSVCCRKPRRDSTMSSPRSSAICSAVVARLPIPAAPSQPALYPPHTRPEPQNSK